APRIGLVARTVEQGGYGASRSAHGCRPVALVLLHVPLILPDAEPAVAGFGMARACAVRILAGRCVAAEADRGARLLQRLLLFGVLSGRAYARIGHTLLRRRYLAG